MGETLTRAPYLNCRRCARRFSGFTKRSGGVATPRDSGNQSPEIGTRRRAEEFDVEHAERYQEETNDKDSRMKRTRQNCGEVYIREVLALFPQSDPRVTMMVFDRTWKPTMLLFSVIEHRGTLTRE